MRCRWQRIFCDTAGIFCCAGKGIYMEEKKTQLPAEEEKDPREKNVRSLKFFWNGLIIIFLVISAVKMVQIGNISGFVMTAATAIILVIDFLMWKKIPKDIGFYGMGRAVLIGLIICSFFVNTGFGNFGVYTKQLKYVESHDYYVKHFPPKVWEGMELISIQYGPKKGLNAIFCMEEEAFFEQMIARTAHESEVMFTLEEYQKGEINETAYEFAKKKINKNSSDAKEPYFHIDGELVQAYPKGEHGETPGHVEIYVLKWSYTEDGKEFRAVVVDRNQNKIEYLSRKF